MKQTGFTLVELLVVVIIMAVLTSIAVPQYRRAMDRSKAAEAMQMLPSLFEARERWVIENQCTWSNGAITACDNNATLTPRKLDIESKFKTRTDDGFKTNNFEYKLVHGKPTSSVDQACISATPVWGSNRGLTSATIWYRGDKFSCNGSQAGCDILNVSTKKNTEGNMVYEGCQ